MELSIKTLQKREQKYSTELQISLQEFAEIRKRANSFDGLELVEERLNIRLQKQKQYYAELRKTHGIKFDSQAASENLAQTDNMLSEDLYSQKRSILERLHRLKYEQPRAERKQKHKKCNDWDLDL